MTTKTGDGAVRASPVRMALRFAGFRRLFLAQTVSRWGDTFNAVAVVVLVYRLTDSALRVGGAVAFEIAPVLLFGLVAGRAVDRRPRRQVMVAADLGRAVIALVLAASHSRVGVVYGCAFGLSALGVFFNPAAASALPALVDEDERALLGANSATWSAAVVSQIALAPAAGALVAVAGAGPAFILNAASFLVSASLLAGLPGAQPVGVGAAASPRSMVRDGLAAIRASRFLSTLAAVQGLAALSAGATSALLVVLAERRLHAGPGRFGLLLGAIGAGAGLGPLALQRLLTSVPRRWLVFGPYLVRGAVDLVLATVTSFAAASAALGVYGVGTSTGMVTYNSVLQTTVPDALRGRVFAFYDVVWQAARLASIAGGGLLADRFGVRAVYYLGGLVLLAAGAIGLGRVVGPPSVTPADS